MLVAEAKEMNRVHRASDSIIQVDDIYKSALSDLVYCDNNSKLIPDEVELEMIMQDMRSTTVSKQLPLQPVPQEGVRPTPCHNVINLTGSGDSRNMNSGRLFKWSEKKHNNSENGVPLEARPTPQSVRQQSVDSTTKNSMSQLFMKRTEYNIDKSKISASSLSGKSMTGKDMSSETQVISGTKSMKAKLKLVKCCLCDRNITSDENATPPPNDDENDQTCGDCKRTMLLSMQQQCQDQNFNEDVVLRLSYQPSHEKTGKRDNALSNADVDMGKKHPLHLDHQVSYSSGPGMMPTDTPDSFFASYCPFSYSIVDTKESGSLPLVDCRRIESRLSWQSLFNPQYLRLRSQNFTAGIPVHDYNKLSGDVTSQSTIVPAFELIATGSATHKKPQVDWQGQQGGVNQSSSFEIHETIFSSDESDSSDDEGDNDIATAKAMVSTNERIAITEPLCAGGPSDQDVASNGLSVLSNDLERKGNNVSIAKEHDIDIAGNGFVNHLKCMNCSQKGNLLSESNLKSDNISGELIIEDDICESPPRSDLNVSSNSFRICDTVFQSSDESESSDDDRDKYGINELDNCIDGNKSSGVIIEIPQKGSVTFPEFVISDAIFSSSEDENDTECERNYTDTNDTVCSDGRIDKGDATTNQDDGDMLKESAHLRPHCIKASAYPAPVGLAPPPPHRTIRAGVIRSRKVTSPTTPPVETPNVPVPCSIPTGVFTNVDELTNEDEDEDFDMFFVPPTPKGVSNKCQSLGIHVSEDASSNALSQKEALVNNSFDIPCAACTECDTRGNNDSGVFCDGKCGSFLHLECIGLTKLPSSTHYFCESCEARRSTAIHGQDSSAGQDLIKCTLCKNTGGSLRRSTCDNWVHSVCAIFTPELILSSTSNRLMNMADLNREREVLKCDVCKGLGGSNVQCAFGDCLTSFHPYCAFVSKKQMIIRQDSESYCHSEIYCNVHKFKVPRGVILSATVPLPGRCIEPFHNAETPKKEQAIVRGHVMENLSDEEDLLDSAVKASPEIKYKRKR
jgi:hypothetical protein